MCSCVSWIQFNPDTVLLFLLILQFTYNVCSILVLGAWKSWGDTVFMNTVHCTGTADMHILSTILENKYFDLLP